MKGPILGWDVGGAYLKVARIEDDRQGQPVVLQWAFPLWREPARLSSRLLDAAAQLGETSAMAVTMTAELADCFATKREGVEFVLDAFLTAFPGVDLRIYGIDGYFRTVRQAREFPHQVAAANWMASATLVARSFPDALFIDVGSTTTDVIPIVGGRVVASGLSDPARLCTGELVYTGVLRTPICAIVAYVPLRSDRCRVAAEYFAIAADIHVWLRHIGESDYTCETPDGRGRGRIDAAARMARMVCADLEMLDEIDITVIARHVAQAQVEQIGSGIRQVMRRLGPACPASCVLAGTGAFAGRAAAIEAGLVCHDVADRIGPEAARVAPAAAVAYLLAGTEV